MPPFVNDILVQQEESKAEAHKHVITILQIPDQLEKVDQHKKRVIRKKTSVEAMLKSAVQSQLDGVNTGISLLATTKVEIADIQKKLDEADHIYSELSMLAVQLQDIREESFRHSQTGTLMDHLKHIFNLNGSITRTQDLIQEGNFLAAHKALSDLESSRDDLFYELHKQTNSVPSDKAMLKQYFAEVERLSEDLGKQLWLIFKRTLNTVRKEPQVIVTALRLIMREEWADEAALKRQEATEFLSPSRPKRWRKKTMEILEQSVAERLEANQIEGRSENKMWLVRHLEVIRQFIIEDLKTVKHHCTPCFPPAFDIFNEWVRMIHNCLSQRLQMIISQGLEDSEYIHILSWLRTYNSRDLMKHPDVNVDITTYEALLPQSTIKKLIEKYVNGLRTKFEEWLRNALITDNKDWEKDVPPETDTENYYRTEAPMLIYQMITQHIDVARTVSPDLVSCVLKLAEEQLDKFLKDYLQLVTEYKIQNFEDRSRFKCYTPYMIALCNNAVRMRELFSKIFDGQPLSGKLSQKIDQLNKNAIDYLCEEVLTDIRNLMPNLMTKRWLTNEEPTTATVIVTLEDYGTDYTSIIEYHTLISNIEKLVANCYMRAICEKRMTLKVYDERKAVAEHILSDVTELKKQFKIMYSGRETDKPLQESQLEVLELMAEVLKLKDSSLLSLEMSQLVNKFPEVSAEDLMALLELRNDIPRAEARQLIIELKPGTAADRTIFSNLLPNL